MFIMLFDLNYFYKLKFDFNFQLVICIHLKYQGKLQYPLAPKDKEDRNVNTLWSRKTY